VQRDSRYAGIPCTFDQQRIVRGLKLKASRTTSGENELRLSVDKRTADDISSFQLTLLSLYKAVYLHKSVRLYETHWDRFCSSLKLGLNSEDTFLKTDWVTLLAWAKELSKDNRDAQAIINRKPFKMWATNFFLGNRVHEELINRIMESLQSVRGDKILDEEIFPLARESRIAPAIKPELPGRRTINQIRVVAETDIARVFRKMPLREAA
jgi:HD superfamily phosphohydrolase